VATPCSGGGNSAGQATVFLAPKVKRLHLIVRGKGLEATMSRYLIDRIGALPNVELHVGTEVLALEGDRPTCLTGAVFRDRSSGATRHCPLRHLFLFIGAEPNASWLQNCAATDEKAKTSGAARAEPAATLCLWKPAFQTYLRSVTSAPARRSVSRRQSAKALPWWHKSIRPYRFRQSTGDTCNSPHPGHHVPASSTSLAGVGLPVAAGCQPGVRDSHRSPTRARDK
jgi:hypothetical protein